MTDIPCFKNIPGRTCKEDFCACQHNLPISESEFQGFCERHSIRAEHVDEAHRRHTVWCCSSNAEECFNDLTFVLSYIAEWEREIANVKADVLESVAEWLAKRKQQAMNANHGMMLGYSDSERYCRSEAKRIKDAGRT